MHSLHWIACMPVPSTWAVERFLAPVQSVESPARFICSCAVRSHSQVVKSALVRWCRFSRLKVDLIYPRIIEKGIAEWRLFAGSRILETRLHGEALSIEYGIITSVVASSILQMTLVTWDHGRLIQNSSIGLRVSFETQVDHSSRCTERFFTVQPIDNRVHSLKQTLSKILRIVSCGGTIEGDWKQKQFMIQY